MAPLGPREYGALLRQAVVESRGMPEDLLSRPLVDSASLRMPAFIWNTKQSVQADIPLVGRRSLYTCAQVRTLGAARALTHTSALRTCACAHVHAPCANAQTHAHAHVHAHTKLHKPFKTLENPLYRQILQHCLCWGPMSTCGVARGGQ